MRFAQVALNVAKATVSRYRSTFGGGKSPLGSRRRGNVLIYGLLWAAGLIGFFSLMGVVHSRVFTAIGVVAWCVFWHVLFYRDGQRKKASPTSRF